MFSFLVSLKRAASVEAAPKFISCKKHKMLNRYKITIIGETIKGQFPDGFLLLVEKIPGKKQPEQSNGKSKLKDNKK